MQMTGIVSSLTLWSSKNDRVAYVIAYCPPPMSSFKGEQICSFSFALCAQCQPQGQVVHTKVVAALSYSAS